MKLAVVDLGVLRRQPVLANAATLFGSTVITSLLGFAFWFVAARVFPVYGVGIASAALSAMQLLATMGILGLGTLMIGELADRRYVKGLVSAAAVSAGVVSGVLGGLFLALTPLISADMGPLRDTPAGVLVFVAGVALAGATLVLDQASIGLQRGDLQLARNTVFSFVKLVLLPLGMLMADTRAALAIYGAWLTGNVVSLVTFVVQARVSGVRPHLRPAFRSLGAIRSTALAHHWLNLAAQGPRLVLPVLVAATLSPAANAAFYTAMLIVGFAAVIPAHLATALFVIPRGEDARLASELRSTLRVSAVVGVSSAVIFAVVARPALSLFGSEYVVAATSMAILGLSTLPSAVKVHYAAVSRVRGRLGPCALVSAAGGILELGAAYAGGRLWGLSGVSAGFLVALTLEAVLLWPTVASAAGLRLSGSHAT